MNKTMTKTVAKMNPMVVECELSAAMRELECNLRHGIEPSKALADYIVALTKRHDAR